MRNKLTGILLAFVCVLALTACGSSQAPAEQEISEELAKMLYSYAENDAQQIDMIVRSGTLEEQDFEKAVYNGMQSWAAAIEEIGEVDFTTDADGDGTADCFTEKSVSEDEDHNYIVTVGIEGSKKTADLVITYKTTSGSVVGYDGIVANVNYSSSELIKQAGLNTLLGMGTTFAVLILLSVIIAIFGRILVSAGKKKAEEKERKEREEAQARAAAAVSDTPKAPESEPEAVIPETSGQDEIIAVIAAAIAAYNAQAQPDVPADPDAYVVRRIRRIKRK